MKMITKILLAAAIATSLISITMVFRSEYLMMKLTSSGLISRMWNVNEIVDLHRSIEGTYVIGAIFAAVLFVAGIISIVKPVKEKVDKKKVDKKGKKVGKKIGKTIVDNIKKVVPIKKEKDVEEIEAEFEEVKLEK